MRNGRYCSRVFVCSVLWLRLHHVMSASVLTYGPIVVYFRDLIFGISRPVSERNASEQVVCLVLRLFGDCHRTQRHGENKGRDKRDF
jgi:hypothetical protein